MSSAPNPFQAPASETALPSPAASYKLHSANAVALASFLGSMFAGGALMALNSKRLGKDGDAVKTLLITAVATVVMLLISAALPDNFPGAALVVPQILMMKKWAESSQGADLHAHERAGGRIASKWAAAGIGLLGLFLVFSGAMVVAYFTGALDE